MRGQGSICVYDAVECMKMLEQMTVARADLSMLFSIHQSYGHHHLTASFEASPCLSAVRFSRSELLMLHALSHSLIPVRYLRQATIPAIAASVPFGSFTRTVSSPSSLAG